MTHPIRSVALATVALVAAVAACDDEPLSPSVPTMAQVAGDYATADSFTALSFSTVLEGDDVDWLEHGANLTIRLADDGTTSGELWIPVPADTAFHKYFESDDLEAGGIREDLTGTWSLDGSTVEFAHDADTFIRDMPFTYVDGTLTGDKTFSTLRIQVVLAKR